MSQRAAYGPGGEAPSAWHRHLTSSLHGNKFRGFGCLPVALGDEQRLPHIDVKFLPEDLYYDVI